MFGNNRDKKTSTTGEKSTLEQRMAASEQALEDLIRVIEDDNLDITVLGELYVVSKHETPSRVVSH